MSTGMNAQTGLSLSGIEHLKQSIAQILTTPIGSRVMRRSFGSLLPELIDQPLNDRTVLQLYAATATALLMHEPRLRVVKVTLDIDDDVPGRASLLIDGIADVDSSQQSVSVPVNMLSGG